MINFLDRKKQNAELLLELAELADKNSADSGQIKRNKSVEKPPTAPTEIVLSHPKTVFQDLRTVKKENYINYSQG